MNFRKNVQLRASEDVFFNIEFIERERFFTQGLLYSKSSHVMMQVDDIVIVLFTTFMDHQFPTMGQDMQLVDMRIVFDDRAKGFLGEEVYFCVGDLFFKTADHRRGEDYVADRGESYD